MAVTVTIILPTKGRRTLRNAIDSAISQMRPGDELYVTFDASGDCGDGVRNRMVAAAHGTLLTFLDDDDEYRPGALDAIRRFGEEHPGRIGIFRISNDIYGPYWVEEDPDYYGTANAMLVVPNVPGRLGTWEAPPWAKPGRSGDYKFLTETIALQGQPPIWRTEVIQDISPEKNRLKRLRYRLRLGTRLKRALGRPTPEVEVPRRRPPDAPAWAAENARRLLEERGLTRAE